MRLPHVASELSESRESASLGIRLCATSAEKPKVYTSFLDDSVPTTVRAALQSSNWTAAIRAELNALHDNKTWSLVPLPKGRAIVGCKWLFKIKKNPDGSVQRYKARLVAKGYSQVPGYDFKDTYSPVVKFATLNSALTCWFEELAADGSPLVCKLHKALYGLRQAPRNWHDKLKVSLQQMGFVESVADVSLFVKCVDSCYTFVLVYVDDIIITGESKEDVERVIQLMQRDFSLKDLGELNFFLGIEVLTDAREYRSLVGALLYVCHTRPDIAFSVHKVAQHMHAPCECHMTAVRRILRYLAGTLEYGLTFVANETDLKVVAFADADWGGDANDRRSVSGHAVFLGKCPVVWSSKKQKTISRSTMEAEYRSVADTAVEVTWINALLVNLGHVDMDVHFIREKVAAKALRVSYVPANFQVADGLTKPLTKAAFKMFRAKIEMDEACFMDSIIGFHYICIEECHSSESGWTTYFGFPLHGGDNGYSEKATAAAADDDSMASDASSGPRHPGHGTTTTLSFKHDQEEDDVEGRGCFLDKKGKKSMEKEKLGPMKNKQEE
ncbi:hypothetical protein F3Y22_tig00111160pilonHSYRG00043 [Hibiscus syriacus]|uniref:Reverse transcriptase Ty1/copia-type domain-containing protein n=1 Tax=Hibiscus syriacus TaxID=106335 RepID=A0A6A2YX82_HIBSY|nr:hypothetical protein F3Y22_tig00111160pilonHSYRG00043 [Hibiscus syriacus]